MLKPLTISAFVLGIVLAGPLAAQETGKPPAAMPEAGGKAETGAKTEAGAGGPPFIPEQAEDQVLANSVIGADVVDVNGNEVGTVKDLILDKEGNAVGVVVSWGGVMGIGGKDVGVSFAPAQLEEGEKPQTKLLRLNVNRDQIEAAPEFMDMEDKKAEAARANRSSGAAPRRKE